MPPRYDALLVVSFGGPEKREDVIPFLENVLRGRNVPRERMLEVAEHYYHFGGRSPINDQNRALIEALASELSDLDLPRADGPVGSFLAVDPTGRTGHPRIWAVGNLVSPQATVPLAISSGATAGALINFELVTEEFDAAVARPAPVA